MTQSRNWPTRKFQRAAPAFVFGMVLWVMIGGPGKQAQARFSPRSVQQDDSVEQEWVRPFSVIDVNGETCELKASEEPRYSIVVFLGVECPLAKLYSLKINKLVDEFKDEPVRVIALDSNRQDSEQEIKDFVKRQSLNYPVARDTNNTIADQFEASRTPEVFLVDHQLRIRYQGRVDDQYLPGIARSKPTRDDLREALLECLGSQEVSIPRTTPQGCLIGRVTTEPAEASPSRVTFANSAARVLNQHCVECHRAGEIGPFVLDDYDEAAGWAEMIVEVIDDGRMPPWHAAPGHRELANARTMPEADKQILRDWLAAGAPKGDAAQIPESQTYVGGWRLPREPDLIVDMGRDFEVPADGTVEYQYFVVDPGLEEATWVSAAEVIPGNRSVVHHSIVFVRPPDGSEFRGSGWIGAYVPGQGHVQFAEGHARLIPAGSKLVFQQHYTPTGKATTDRTRVGLIFTPADQVTHEVITLIGIDQAFEIPPHAENHQVQLQVPWLPEHGQLLSVSPHMHWRGKSFELWARKGEQRKPLVNVPDYDFNWQHNYRFAEPIDLDECDGLEFTVTFDNSKNNPSNPDPTEYVMWGDQTWEEMAVAFFEVSRPLYRTSEAAGTSETAENEPGENDPGEDGLDESLVIATDSPAAVARARKVAKMVDAFFERFDKNRNGVVEQDELPRSVNYGRWQFDWDYDGLLTREDVEAYVEAIVD